ncbi:hypothetical protein L484_017936 [Morus notabilis]|uniref:Uncharacterized protein n=1 Tax=Morus notabilis TaxID=981085 RepID=W9RA35_9ROSA|nr:hypothetical protein L484_017936 [Morus notabilis]
MTKGKSLFEKEMELEQHLMKNLPLIADYPPSSKPPFPFSPSSPASTSLPLTTPLLIRLGRRPFLHLTRVGTTTIAAEETHQNYSSETHFFMYIMFI